MDYKEIQDLIKLVKKNQITELEIEKDDFKISIKSQSEEPIIQQLQVQAPQAVQMAPQINQPAPVSTVQPVAPALAVPPPVENSNLIEIKSPMIGTFYRAAGPDKDPFVAIGDVVSNGQIICMVEAMKLFNEIESEVEGKIVKILVEDAAPIEYDQPLFLVEPKT